MITHVYVSDGGTPISKHIIGTEVFDILLTSTFLLEPRACKLATVGPSMNRVLHGSKFSNSRVLLQESKIKEFNKNKESKETMSSCRQINSDMDHVSSYYSFRSTLFNQITLSNHDVLDTSITELESQVKAAEAFYWVNSCVLLLTKAFLEALYW
ncbi:hypothetical protein K501DRAFT_281239 [Backusella circina FSU 941]|nr:hypothetical protein K501DRAFT_281239 [Backusella circina FSU 941]